MSIRRTIVDELLNSCPMIVRPIAIDCDRPDGRRRRASWAAVQLAVAGGCRANSGRPDGSQLPLVGRLLARQPPTAVRQTSAWQTAVVQTTVDTSHADRIRAASRRLLSTTAPPTVAAQTAAERCRSDSTRRRPGRLQPSAVALAAVDGDRAGCSRPWLGRRSPARVRPIAADRHRPGSSRPQSSWRLSGGP